MIVTLVFHSTASGCVNVYIISLVAINLQEKAQFVEFASDVFNCQVLGETSRVSFTGAAQRVCLCFLIKFLFHK
jgi:hypothetical protein